MHTKNSLCVKQSREHYQSQKMLFIQKKTTLICRDKISTSQN